MKYKGVIFDLDGVICFTDEYHFIAWKKLAEEIGAHGFTREDNLRQRGVSRMESLEVVLEKTDKKYTQAEKVALAERKNAYYKELLKEMGGKDLSPEVKKTLFLLRSEGVKLAIGSSSKNAKFILGRLGLGDFFDAVSDGNNITRSKPDPEVFLKAAEFLGLVPSECIVVEDAEAGIDAACAGGFDSAGIGPAASYGKATFSLASFEDIADIVLRAR